MERAVTVRPPVHAGTKEVTLPLGERGWPRYLAFELKSDGLALSVGLDTAGGVVVQIKAREGEPGTVERETSWGLKQLTAAGKQVQGTVRRLKAQGVQMVNGRGRSVSIDSPAVDWADVIIIEHPDLPQELAIATQDGNTPVIALLRRDWEFPFNYELAAADAEAVPGALDPSWTRRGGQPHSVPLLPAAPAGSDDDEARTMVRIMLEAWQQVLASLDSLPVGYRTDLGRFLLDTLAAVTQAEQGTTAWRMRTFLAGPD